MKRNFTADAIKLTKFVYIILIHYCPIYIQMPVTALPVIAFKDFQNHILALMHSNKVANHCKLYGIIFRKRDKINQFEVYGITDDGCIFNSTIQMPPGCLQVT